MMKINSILFLKNHLSFIVISKIEYNQLVSWIYIHFPLYQFLSYLTLWLQTFYNLWGFIRFLWIWLNYYTFMGKITYIIDYMGKILITEQFWKWRVLPFFYFHFYLDFKL